MALNATMRAVVWEGQPFQMPVRSELIPTLLAETDALVRVTASAICGSDLHIYRGIYGSPQVPWTMGHEGMGLVQEIGDSVSHISVGDLVVIPGATDSGHLEMYGPEMGVGYGLGRTWGDADGSGCQAEYVRVPYADLSLIPVPTESNNATNPGSNTTTAVNATNGARDLDYLFLSDIFPTGWAALDFAHFEPGDSVAVFGAGPVGLLSAYSAIIRGASTVYVVDYVQSRLDLAESIGAIPINFVKTNPVEEILRREPYRDVVRLVDYVGAEAFNRDLDIKQDIIVRQMIAIIRIGGSIGQVGIISAFPNTLGTLYSSIILLNISFPLLNFYNKRLSFISSSVDYKLYTLILSKLISSGKARPSFIINHEISIEDILEYYRSFKRREVIKVIIHFL